MQSKISPANLIKTSLCHGILLYQKATLFIKYNGIDQNIGNYKFDYYFEQPQFYPFY